MISEASDVRRVLLVDDEASVCELVRDAFDAFARGTIELTCVNSDAAAYRALLEEPPFDPILVDINLGVGTTGYDVARRARAIRPDVRVIYISGQADERSVATYGVPGGVLLPKPFTPEQLLAAMDAVAGPED